MPDDTEEWLKIRRKTDLLLQMWQIFGELWPEHLKVSKLCTLNGSICAKYMTFDLKKYRGIILHDTVEWCKIWEKSDLWLRKWNEAFSKFLLEHLKCQNWHFDGILLSKVENT